jgi:hypothetical protein
LIVVKTNFTDAGIIDGVNYIFQRASVLGKPAVVNLSAGTQKGGHDGSHSFDLAISALTGPGKLVTAAVGNDRSEDIHAVVDMGAGASEDVPFVISAYTPTTVFPEAVFLEGWHDPSASFRVKLRSPGGTESGWIDPGETSGSVGTLEGTYRIDNATLTNSKGGKLIAVNVWRSGTAGTHPSSGTWTITLSREPGTASGICHFWVAHWNLGGGDAPVFRNPDPGFTIACPATADEVIATGAYATKTRWANAAGGTSSFGSVPLGEAAYFSAAGPRRDGTSRPDLVAPGYGVAASLSADAPSSLWDQVPDQVHNVRAGTSQANAHTTGALALILADRRQRGLPDPTPSQARQILLDRVREDLFTGTGSELPNPRYGFGKLNLLELSPTTTLEEVPPEVFAFRVPYPNPSSETSTFQFAVTDEDLAGTERRVEVRIFDVSGRLVRTMIGIPLAGEQQLLWDGRITEGRHTPNGVYFAHLVVGEKSAIRKLVRVGR